MRFYWGLLSLSISFLAVLLLAVAAYPDSGVLDSYGCHHDRQRGDYHCHAGEFAGQTFGSVQDMLRKMQTGKKTEENRARDKLPPDLAEIERKIEEHFKKLENERGRKEQEKEQESVGVTTAPQEPKQGAEDSFPFVFLVKENDIPLYARHDEYSKVIGTVKKGERLYPVGQTLGRGEVWYFVKTVDGRLGWVKAPRL